MDMVRKTRAGKPHTIPRSNQEREAGTKAWRFARSSTSRDVVACS